MRMKLLDRYIARTVISAIGLVVLLLAGLQVFILGVNQLADLGKADYGLWQAAIYVLQTMPYEVYLFFPMASLLGCLIGLGNMATHQELVIMRASGLSMLQITAAMVKIALILIMSVTLLGEIYLPKLVRTAHQQKSVNLSGEHLLKTETGVWLRANNDFILIGAIISDHHLKNILQFHFDKQHRLTAVRQLEELMFNQGIWSFKNSAETLIFKDHTQVRNRQEGTWGVVLLPRILGINQREPDEMTLHELHQSIRAKKSNHQQFKQEELAYWQRLTQPMTTLVMMLLAIPFIFGPLRSSTMGSKLLTGAAVGFGFYIFNRFLGSASLVYQWPPLLAAIGPTGVFAFLGVYLMRKVR